MPKPRLIHVITSEDMYGPEKTIVNECRILMQEGWDCLVVNLHPNRDCPYAAKVAAAGIPYRHVDVGQGLSLSGLRRLRTVFAQQSPSLVHSHGYKADVLCLPAAWWAGVPAVTTIHGWTSENTKVRLYEKAQTLAWRFYRRVYCVSGFYRDIALKRGVPRAKLELIYNGILLDEAPPSAPAGGDDLPGLEAEARIGIVGRLSPEKNHRFFMDVARRVKASGSSARFWIIGEGPERDGLEAYRDEHELAGCVELLGHRNDMAALYAHMDILVICSLREGLPNVLLEAMKHGVAVVSLPVGGVPEVIGEERGGLLVTEADPEPFAEALLGLIRNPERRRALGIAGQARIREAFDFRVRSRRFADEYLRLLGLEGR